MQQYGNKLINVKNVTAENVTINGQPFTGVEDAMVPPAVLATLQPHLKGRYINLVDKQTDGGTVVYKFIVAGAGKRDSVFIAEDGTPR